MSKADDAQRFWETVGERLDFADLKPGMAVWIEDPENDTRRAAIVTGVEMVDGERTFTLRDPYPGEIAETPRTVMVLG